LDAETVKQYFLQSSVVDHYAQACNGVGLWKSEEIIFTRLFKPDDQLLELGCGAGRIAIGLHEIGYEQLLATDFSRLMVKEARRIAHILGYRILFRVADATQLPFADEMYDGVIFGFNGLMQIPGRENRRYAMQEIFRVLKPGAYFAFTAHDREVHWRKGYWKEQRSLWGKGKQHPGLTEFGDVYYKTPEGGMMFIHSPTCQEVRDDLKAAGFRVESDKLRSQLCRESERVLDFSDDCRFWIAQRPA